MNEQIYIDEVINKINMLGNEKNKNNFILNYNGIQSQLNIIDEILDSKNELDESLQIDDLFNLLETYSKYIESNIQIDIIQFKKLKNLTELIERKLSSSNSFQIKEFK